MKTRKWIQVLMVIIAIVMLGACGGGGNTDNGKKQEDKQEQKQDENRSEIASAILKYAKDKKNKQPTLKDYEASGITGVTKDNLDEVNHQVAIHSVEDVDTKKELQEIVDALQRVLNGEHETRFAAIGGTHYSLTDGMEAERVFHDGIPYVENFKIVRSNHAATILNYDDAPHTNENDLGRYLEIGYVPMGNDQDIIVKFDQRTIWNALGSIDVTSVHNAEIYLWNEYGTEMVIDLYGLTTFSASPEGWISRTDDIQTHLGPIIERYNITAGIGWKKIRLPLELLQQWDRDRNYGILLKRAPSQQHQHMRFSSDETRRAPALVMYYMQPGYLPTRTVEQALGEDNETDNEIVQLDVTSDLTPRVGESYTVTATADDNVELDYIVIKDIGNRKIKFENKTGNTHATLSYTTVAGSSHNRIEVCAEDTGGRAPRKCRSIHIEPRENTAPAITSTIKYLDVEEVYPEYYRLIKYDNQPINIHVDANDSDGIKQIVIETDDGNGGVHREVFDDVNVSTADYKWINNKNLTEFKYKVIVTDRTGIESTYESDPVPIRGAEDLILYRHALPFKNQARVSEMGKKYMPYIYGNEVYGPFGKLTLRAKYWYPRIKTIADEGVCYGMAASSIALTTGEENLTPAILTDNPSITTSAGIPANVDDISDYTRRFIHAKQASQISKKNRDILIDYNKEHKNDHQWTLQEIINSLDGTFANYGILNVFSEDEGHAIVPWMVRKMRGGWHKVYVYDSNLYGYVQTVQQGNLPTFEKLPYVKFFVDNAWEYDTDQDPSTSQWSNYMFFTSHAAVVGGSSYNTIEGNNAPELRDHALPHYIKCALHHVGSLMVDGDKKVTVAIKGDVIQNRTVSGKEQDSSELYWISANKTFTVNVTAKEDTQYTIQLNIGDMFVYVKNKSIKAKTTDTYVIAPNIKKAGYSMDMTSAQADDTFEIEGISEYQTTHDKEIRYAQKRYQIKNIKLDAQSTLHLELNKFANSLKVKTAQQSPFAFDLTVEKTNPDGKIETLFDKTVEPEYISGARIFNYTMSEK